MNVYVEIALLDNLAVDCLLLCLASLTLRVKVRWYRLLLGSLVGAICALLTVVLQGGWLYIAKLCALLLMCVVSVGFGKKLFWFILLTVAYTFLLGGAIVGLFNFASDNLVNGVIYQSDIPLFVYVIAIFAVGFLAYCIVNYLKQVKSISQNLIKAVVRLDKDYFVTAFCDSGNCATLNGLPVCLVGKRFADHFSKMLLLGKTQKLTVTTAVGQKQLLAVSGQITVKEKTYETYFALSKSNPYYDVILSNQFR